MSLYSYTALNAQKERMHGMVDAISLQAGRSALQASGLFVEEIHEATPLECDAAKPWETVAVQEPMPLSPVEGLGTRDSGLGVSNNVLSDEQFPAPSPPFEGMSPSGPNGQHRVPNYYPLLDTLRLYAGWLLAWYVLVMSLGAYQETKSLPFMIPLVEGLWQSVLIIRAAFGVFLFLMLTSLYRFFGRRGWMGGGLGFLGVFLFYVFLVNT